MNIPLWLAAVARVVFVAAMVVVLLLSPLYILVTPGFVRFQYAQRGFPPAERFDDAERIRISDPVLLYLRGRASRGELAAVRTNSGEIAFLDSEVQHLADVKLVMDAFFRLHGAGLLLAILGFALTWCSARRKALPLDLRQSTWIAAGLIVCIVGASLIDFDTFFTRFHQLFFSEGSWLFYETDTLIQLYPLPLWISAVWQIGVVIAVELGLVNLVAFWLERTRWLRGS